LFVVAAEESSRAAYLRNLDKKLESEAEIEKEEGVEEVDTRSDKLSVAASRAASGSSASHGEARERRVIRFEDGDAENPNNCMSILSITVLGDLANFNPGSIVRESMVQIELGQELTPPVQKGIRTLRRNHER
jgi:hypothetical protein